MSCFLTWHGENHRSFFKVAGGKILFNNFVDMVAPVLTIVVPSRLNYDTLPKCLSSLQTLVMWSSRLNRYHVSWANGLVRESHSRSRGLEFKTTAWLLDRLSLSSFRSWSNKYQELLGNQCEKVMSARSDSVALRQMNLIHKKGAIKIFFSLLGYNNH